MVERNSKTGKTMNIDFEKDTYGILRKAYIRGGNNFYIETDKWIIRFTIFSKECSNYKEELKTCLKKIEKLIEEDEFYIWGIRSVIVLENYSQIDTSLNPLSNYFNPEERKWKEAKFISFRYSNSQEYSSRNYRFICFERPDDFLIFNYKCQFSIKKS